MGIGPRSFLKGRPRYGKVFFQKGIVSVGQCQGSVHSHAGSYVYQWSPCTWLLPFSFDDSIFCILLDGGSLKYNQIYPGFNVRKWKREREDREGGGREKKHGGLEYKRS